MHEHLQAIYWIALIVGIVVFIGYGLDLNPNNRPLVYGPVTPPSSAPQLNDMLGQVNQVGEGHLSQIRKFSPNTVGMGHASTQN